MPPGFQVQLKCYQQITVSWMKELEEKVEEGWRISRLINWKAVSLKSCRVFAC